MKIDLSLAKITLSIAAIAALAACNPQGGAAPKVQAQKSSAPNPMPLPRGEKPADIKPGAPHPAIALSEAAFRRRVAEISDDKDEGRAKTTPGGIAASQWVADEMARIGLKPAVNGSYFERVPLVESTLDTKASDFHFTVGGKPFAIPFGSDEIFWTKRVDPKLEFDNSDVVFVGYGIVAPEYGWDDYAGLDVKGKTVVMLVNDPSFATHDPKLFKGKAMTYYGATMP